MLLLASFIFCYRSKAEKSLTLKQKKKKIKECIFSLQYSKVVLNYISETRIVAVDSYLK